MKNLEGSPTEPAIKTREGVRLDSKTSSHPKKQTRALAETNGQNGVHVRSNSQEPEVQGTPDAERRYPESSTARR